MELPINKTLATEIILLGFTQNWKINFALFPFILVIYIVTIVGNGFMVCVIIISPHLHTPMYVLLCNLSIIDICYSTRTVPRFLVDLLSSSKRIPLAECVLQSYVGMYLGQTEPLLFALMAFDRYVAICRPLRYVIIMRWSVCYRLIALVYLTSFTGTALPIILVRLVVCNPNEINHFTCEAQGGLKLSCYPISEVEFVTMLLTSSIIITPFILILLSYTAIISSILKLHSSGRSKAFSTCTSHVIVVSMFYGSAMVIFFTPLTQYTSDQEKYASVVNLILMPMINPLIYSLKNKEVTKVFVLKKERIQSSFF
ncbi:olfactory receptor 13C2-like [Dendropsophus ebraccatus]|uniref:olfactory receptor 13C2-like n=1 Tax=Dendropsophus ebraccatus TaxID=150705 RepID=UPI003832124F